VHHQVDRSATSFVVMPVEEFGTRYRYRPTFGTPSGSVATIAQSVPVR